MDDSIAIRDMTIEDLYVLPDDGRRHELMAGVLLSEPLPGMRHGWVTARIVALLDAFARPRGLGVVLTADTGYILARGPDTVRGPDVSFLTWERFRRAEDPAKAYPGAPDLAVEVVSPTDREPDVHAKIADYLTAGTRVVWIVDPQTETVEVYRTLLSPRRLRGEDSLEAEEVLPGLSVCVSELFTI